MTLNSVLIGVRRTNCRNIFVVKSLIKNNNGLFCKCGNFNVEAVSSSYIFRNSSTTVTSVNKFAAANQEPGEEGELLSRLSESRQKKRLVEEPEETEQHVIYQGLLAGQMRRLKIFSLTTSGMGLVMQPILFQKSTEVPLAANIAVFGMIGFFTYVTPFLIHAIARKYVTEMSYDPGTDTYSATTWTFFLRKKDTKFKIEDVKVPEVPGPFTTIQVKSKEGKYDPLFIAPEAFTKPSHYGRLMGYDKPIDLRLTVGNDSGAEGNEKVRKEKS